MTEQNTPKKIIWEQEPEDYQNIEPQTNDEDRRGESYEETKWLKDDFDKKKKELLQLAKEFVELTTPQKKDNLQTIRILQNILSHSWDWDTNDDMRLNTLKEYQEKIANIKSGKTINKQAQDQQYIELEKNLKENKFEKISFEELDEYVNRQKHFTFLKQDFIDLFGQFSFENEILAEMFYHVAVGMQFKDQKLMGSNGPLNVNASLIIIQNSGCLEENTLLQTWTGQIPIKNCPSLFSVLSYNFEKKIQEYKPAIKIYSGTKDVYNITFEDGHTVECTQDHKFFEKDTHHEIPAHKFKIGLQICAGQPHQPKIGSTTIKSIDYIGKRRTYDLKVVHNHNFFLANGILTHNSGKDQAIDFFLRFIDRMNTCIGERKLALKPFRYAQLSGSESMEVLLDHYPKKAKGDGDDTEGGIINGILSSRDLIVARECSYLFKDVQGEKVQKRELFLQALESKPIEKTLVKWNGNWTTTKTNLAFIGTSRPFHNMKSHIAESGFQQRCLNYCANISIDRIKKMVYKSTNSKLRNDEEKQRLETMIKDIANRFVDIRAWLQTHTLNIEPKDIITITNLTGSWLIDKLENIEKDIPSKEHENILSSFVSRFSHHLLVLSYHNAASEKRNNIALKDFYLALALLNELYITFSDWMYEYIPEDKTLTAKESQQVRIIKQHFIIHDPEDKGIEREKLAKSLSAPLRLSESYILKLLSRFARAKSGILYYENNKLKLQHTTNKKIDNPNNITD